MNIKRFAIRSALTAGASVILLSLLVLIVGCCSFSGPSYKGAETEYFNGTRFVNQEGEQSRGFWDMMKWSLSRESGTWLDWIDAPYGEPPAQFVSGDSLVVTFINHSTTLIQTQGLNILTDPVWSDIVSPVSWIGPTRRRPPGIKFDDLPPIHLVLISHNHYDHCDLPTLIRIKNAHNPKFIISLGNKPLLEAEGITNVEEMNWWDVSQISQQVRVHSVPARHFSMRGICDRNTTLWCGYVIEASSGPIYFAGDTGFGIHFEQIYKRFGKMRLSMIPIGAYRPRWFMAEVHTSPEEAVKAHLILKSQRSIPIHFGTFKQADDGMTEPIEDLQKAMLELGVSPNVFMLPNHGAAVPIPPVSELSESKSSPF